jgi:hypothetical protein
MTRRSTLPCSRLCLVNARMQSHCVDSVHPIRRYTCLMHVFDFADKREYAPIATHGLGRIYSSSAFAHWLLCS